MIGHYREHEYFLKNLLQVPGARVWILSIIMTSVLFTAIGCTSSPTDSKSSEIPFKDNHTVYTKWDDVFENDTVILFTFPDPSVELYSIQTLLLLPDKGYIIADYKAKRVILFDSNAKFVRYIVNGAGVGPGELSSGSGKGCLGNDKTLYLLDLPSFCVNKYVPPDYRFERAFKISFYSQGFLPDKEGNLIHYTCQDTSVLHKISPDGKLLKKAYQVNNLSFRLFSSRFQIGLMDEIPGEGFLFTYPEEYKVVLFDYDLNIKKVLYAATFSHFFPERVIFPSTLSPSDYTPSHAKWWDSAVRVGPPYHLGNGLFFLELYQFKKLGITSFLNLHDMNGKTYAIGLKEPFENSGIFAARHGFIYLVEDSSFDAAGNVTPLKLHRYKLKNQIFSKGRH